MRRTYCPECILLQTVESGHSKAVTNVQEVLTKFGGDLEVSRLVLHNNDECGHLFLFVGNNHIIFNVIF